MPEFGGCLERWWFGGTQLHARWVSHPWCPHASSTLGCISQTSPLWTLWHQHWGSPPAQTEPTRHLCDQGKGKTSQGQGKNRGLVSNPILDLQSSYYSSTRARVSGSSLSNTSQSLGVSQPTPASDPAPSHPLLAVGAPRLNPKA